MNARPRDAWRVAALTMMSPEELHAALSGGDAATWVEAAATCGMPAAQVRLGRLLLEGRGVPKDERAAFACFLCAADSGDVDARNMLGRCYENGWGTTPDFPRAAEHYRIAAEAGYAWSQYNLGHLYLNGTGVVRDRAQAFVWYMRAASQGHARAMNLVARCFEEGWGLERNPAAARNWYRKSAAGGYFRGAYNYATILASEGCIAGARLWFQRALETAPEPTRSTMLAALSQHPEPRLRDMGVAQRSADPRKFPAAISSH
jgi:TPR repeat protein